MTAHSNGDDTAQMAKKLVNEDYPTFEEFLARGVVTTTEDTHREEETVRSHVTKGLIPLFFINGYSAIMVFLLHLISLESIFSIFMSVGFTLLVYYERKNRDNSMWDGGVLDFVLLSFAVVTPMSASLGMAFTRRERALSQLNVIRASFVEMYVAHSIWDWGSGLGRKKSPIDWLKHADGVMHEMLMIEEELCRFLTLPNATRARHRITEFGRSEAHELTKVSTKLFDNIVWRMGRVSLYCEVLKREGLPGNEGSRIRQWERFVLEALEGLRMIKFYRTPQALRSLCRLFSVFLPPFYAPYYAQLATDLDSLGTAITFSIMTSLALTSLFESLTQMEDPFLSRQSLDGIDIPKETGLIRHEILLLRNKLYFPDAPPYDRARNKKDEQETADIAAT